MAKLAFCDYHNMVAILEKTEHNTDFHQIVDFLEASYVRMPFGLCNALGTFQRNKMLQGIPTASDGDLPASAFSYAPTETLIPRRLTRRAIWIAQSKALSPVADKPASLLRDDRQGEAFPTVTSLDAGQDRENIAKTYAMPHESSPRPKLKISTWKYLGADKSTELGSNDTEEMVNVLSSMEAANILSSGGAAASVSPADVFPTADVPTVIGSFSTVSAIFTTSSVVTSYTRRSRGITIGSSQPMRIPIIRANDKGKEKVIETKVPKKRKIQEQIDAQVAREMEEEFARENQRLSKQLARDSEIARIHAE
nr:hypothetical protein [Tanacetum cinerariifolium]